MEVFNTFIIVGALAAVGYAGLVIMFFVSSLRGSIYPHRYMCLINPFIIMVLSLMLSKILPQTPLVNGFLGMGQQSIGLFITFVALYMTSKERNEKAGIVYHREGIMGDYDDFDDLEELISFIRTGKAEG